MYKFKSKYIVIVTSVNQLLSGSCGDLIAIGYGGMDNCFVWSFHIS